jgi:hypothetical protein
VAALLLGVPAGVLIGLLLGQERLDGLGQAPVALIEPARLVDFDERTGVAATLSWTEGPALLAPDWSGTVGQVHLRSRDSIRSGDPVAVIDGVTRLAVPSPQPFFRSLATDDQGPDVGWLHDVLRGLGYLQQVPDDDSRVSEATIGAVRAMAVELGVIGPVDAFDPGWFAWLPEEPFEVESVELTAGAPAPSAGTPLATGAAQLDAVTLQRLDGGPLTPEPGVAYVLEMEGEELPLDADADADADAGTVDADGLVRLSAALPPLLDSASGSVRRVRPLAVWAIPSAAVMSGAQGQLCIWTDAGGRYEALAVDVVAGRAGVTFSRPPTPSALVLHNPAEILAEPACPSA